MRSDAEAGTLTITDTGLGMTKDELRQNLGTIAHSGTKKFAEMLGSKDAASNLIGQFGVGFYSAFLVADRVVVVSKSNQDADQWIWESAADSNFSLVKDPRGNTLGRGTSITLHLKKDADTQGYLKSDKLRDLIIRYSDFISFPIYLWESHVERVTDEEATKKSSENLYDTDDEEEEEEDFKVADEEEDLDEEDEDKALSKKPSLVWDWERINEKQPIWTRRKDDIEEEVRFLSPASFSWHPFLIPACVLCRSTSTSSSPSLGRTWTLSPTFTSPPRVTMAPLKPLSSFPRPRLTLSLTRLSARRA